MIFCFDMSHARLVLLALNFFSLASSVCLLFVMRCFSFSQVARYAKS